ncbi:MAG: hypothetical protein KAJ23_17325 [Maribacter sp.]|nr:hypothetical protein [Maribacter sp.]
MSNSKIDQTNMLTTRITYIVLGGYVVILLVLLVKALSSFSMDNGTQEGEEWLALFRDGFLLLGGILTTLIGYYFGNRGSDVALKQVEEVKIENEKILSHLSAMAPTDEDEDADIESIIL